MWWSLVNTPWSLSSKVSSYWYSSDSGEKNELCRVFLKRTGRVLGQSAAELQLISDVMAVFSTSPNIVCCPGSTLETIRAVDNSPFSEHGLQRPLRFADFSIARLMHKESYSVFGRIDFHSVLQYLIIFLGGCLDFDWTLLTPVLSKVSYFQFSLLPRVPHCFAS